MREPAKIRRNEMLELTDAARERLHKSLSETNETKRAGRCFRIVPKDEKNLTLKLAKPAPSDATFRHNGNIVLALPKALRPFFRNKSLDIDESGKLTLS